MHIPRELENVLGPGIYLQMKGTSFPATHLRPYPAHSQGLVFFRGRQRLWTCTAHCEATSTCGYLNAEQLESKKMANSIPLSS